MEGSPCEGEEAAKDPAAKQPPLGESCQLLSLVILLFLILLVDHEISDNEISSHRHLYVGFHVPSNKGKKAHANGGHGGHRKTSLASSHGHKKETKAKILKLPQEDLRPSE